MATNISAFVRKTYESQFNLSFHTLKFRFYSPSARFHENSYWIVSNFNSGIETLSSEIYESGYFSSGPSLPSSTITTNEGPCIAAITEDLTFYAYENSFIYDWSLETFINTTTPMLFASRSATCSVATKSDGSKIVVVAGG